MTVLSAISAAQPQRIDAGRGRQHTVQHGDTLSGIAKLYGVSLSAPRAANPQVLNPNVIYSGDRITVPGGQSQTGSGGAPVHAGKSATGNTAAKAGSTQLTMADYQRAASTLGVDVATVRAVADVESSGGGFLADGRPKILFERHIFARETGGRFNGSHPGISGSPGGYGAGGANQHTRFEQAFALDSVAAMKSASWGEFQIMGFNHRMVGYDSVGKFVDAMRSSAGNPGGAGGSTPAGGTTGNPPTVRGDSKVDTPAPVDGGSSSNAAKIAEKYLGWWAGDLKVSGHLPMDPSVPNTVNCANFVSAVLQKAGLINFHTNLVTGSNSGNPQALGTMLKAQGWTVVPASQARPGDVAIVNNGDHTELVHSNSNGKITLIGSNNTGGGSGPQKVSYGNPFGNAWYLTPPRK